MNSIKSYILETYNEMVHKVSWPSWNELQSSSVLVLVASLMISIAIFAMDYVFGINADSFWKGILGYYYSLF